MEKIKTAEELIEEVEEDMARIKEYVNELLIEVDIYCKNA